MFKANAPDWFLKELKVIDPTYVVMDPEDHDGYFICKDVDISLKANDGKTLNIIGRDPTTLRARGTLEILWVPALGGQALDELRKMKLKALELGIFENPLDELAYYQKLKRDAKKKKTELAEDMVVEGLMEMHRLERKKSFSYGGSDKKN